MFTTPQMTDELLGEKVATEQLVSGSRHVGTDVLQRLQERLNSKFCAFQVQARSIQERVAATQLPVNSPIVEEALVDYSSSIASEMQRARDELRQGRWDIDDAVRSEHDTLCFCLAVWELVHETAIKQSSLSAPSLLQWYKKHYLEDEIAEWWRSGQKLIEKSDALDDPEFSEVLCRLAINDCNNEVIKLLQRSIAAQSESKEKEQLSRVFDFLCKIPSLHQLQQVKASRNDFAQVIVEIQNSAAEVMRKLPSTHPCRKLLEIYAGCPKERFDEGKDVAKIWGRTWAEDFVYSHAWIWPDFRRTQLGELLGAIAQRRREESIDDIDRVFFAAISLDMPALLKRLGSKPDIFPNYFVTHIVDVLYYAGRLPPKLEVDGLEIAPPRDHHFMAYAEELVSGSRKMQRQAIDYLRALVSPMALQLKDKVVDEYCANAGSEKELEQALALVANLGMQDKLGVQHCRRYAQSLRSKGDIAGCIRWACHAEVCADKPSGYYVSEMLDSIIEQRPEGLSTLVDVLAPPDFSEPLEQYPPSYLLEMIRMPSSKARTDMPTPSGRLYFYTQYARCQAARRARQPYSEYLPTLCRVLVAGVAPAKLASKILEEDVFPALTDADATPPLSTDDTFKLMRYVQSMISDPFHRVRFTMNTEVLHQAMAGCLSRSLILSPSSTVPTCGAGAVTQRSMLLRPGLVA